jgi:diguanylate cyclase (GGDEF)-like protein/PAS domain S-box-containing protein
MGHQPHEQAPHDADVTAAIVAGALDAIITMDHHGHVVEFNPAAERIFGYTRAEAVGRPLASLIIPPLLRAAHRAGLKQYLAGGEGKVIGRKLELIAMRSDRTELPVELTVTSVDTPDGHALFIGFLRDLTHQKRTELELRRTKELYDLVLDNTQDLITLVEPSGLVRYASPSHRSVIGYEPQDLVGANVLDFVHPDDAAMVAQRMAESVASGSGGFVSEIRIRHRDGHWVALEGTGRVVDRQDEPPIILASARDVTDRKRAHEAVLHLAAIVEPTDDAVYSKSLDGEILTWNPGAQLLYGYTAEEAIGRSVSILSPADRPSEIPEILERIRRGERIEHYETERVRKDGSRVHISLSVSPIEDLSGRVIASSAIARDITDRKRAEEQIAFLAYHDKLTGLPNRARFDELITMGLARARRQGLGLAVLYLDLDDFKVVNDTLGHAAGDDLLRQVAQRLLAASRETDGVARLGGDEFMILAPDLPRKPGSEGASSPDPSLVVAETVAGRVQRALGRPFRLGQAEVSVTASIGVSIYPLDADDAPTLFRNADVAMYQSKRSGPGRWQQFQEAPGSTRRAVERSPAAPGDHDAPSDGDKRTRRRRGAVRR